MTMITLHCWDKTGKANTENGTLPIFKFTDEKR